MAKNLYNLTEVTTVNDSDLLHVNQGGVSSDKKVTKQNLLKEVNSSISSLNNSMTYRNGIQVSPGDNTLSSLSSCKFGILYGRYSNIWFSMAFDVASLGSTHQMFISSNAHCNYTANLSTNKFTVSDVVGFDTMVVVLYK